VCPVRMTRSKTAYLVTKYDDIVALLHDERVVKNADNAKTRTGKSGNVWMPRSFRPLMKNMLNVDKPDHRRLRNLVQNGFTVSRINELRPRLEQIADLLLDGIENQLWRGEAVDLVPTVALPFPVTVIAEMIGIPDQDLELMRKMTHRLMVVPSP